MIFVGVLILNNAENSITELSLDNLNNIAEGKEAGIFEYFDNKKGRTVDFSSDGFIRDEVERINGIKSISYKKKASVALNTHLVVNKQSLDTEILEIYALDLNGMIVGSTDESEIGEMTEKDEPYFLNGMERTYIQNIHKYTTHEGEELAVITIGTPLTSRTTGEPIGVLMNRYNVRDIQDILEGVRAEKQGAITSSKLSGTTDIFLVNQTNLMVTPSGHMPDAGFLSYKIETAPIVECIENNSEINEEWFNHKGGNVLGASMCMQIEDDWIMTLVVEQDKAEVLAPVSAMKSLAFIVGIITILIIILIALTTAKSISNPITKLIEAAHSISLGKMDVEIDEKGQHYEINMLAKAFDRMRASVKILLAEDKEMNKGKITNSKKDIKKQI